MGQQETRTEPTEVVVDHALPGSFTLFAEVATIHRPRRGPGIRNLGFSRNLKVKPDTSLGGC